MRPNHRSPLVAFGLVALACALVLGQPSLGGGPGGRGPVVTVLADTGLSPSEFLSRFIPGERLDGIPVVAEVPDGVPDGASGEPPGSGFDIVDDVLGQPPFATPDSGTGGGQGAPPLSAGLTDTGDGGSGPGTGTPNDGTPDGGFPDDGGLFGTPGSDTPRGGRGNDDDEDGPKPHSFSHAPGNGHPYGTAQPPGQGGGQDEGQGGDHPGQGPKDKGDKDKGDKDDDQGDDQNDGPKDKGDKDDDQGDDQNNGPKDKNDKGKGSGQDEDHPGKGPKDKDDKAKGPKDKDDKGEGPKDEDDKDRDDKDKDDKDKGPKDKD